ncbi:MAG TPA: dihydropteroate synthase [Saprospiraceae bacterium]|nr:dihydropteroate synthase [Saprospiraceae bacterium]
MTILCKDRLLDLSQPVVMGILNLTPDSFFDGGKYTHADAILQQAEKMLQEGASILDLGGASSRPGAAEVPEAEEMRRVLPAVTGILQRFPEAILSIDTWRASVADAAMAAGAHIINDISGGSLDSNMFATAGRLQTPYILMHMQGTPQTMQQQPHYEDVVTEVLDYFIEKTARLRAAGVKDIILDPGFGFGKTVAHNYTLLKQLHTFGTVTGLPVLAGISRKSMICKALGVKPEHALNGTTALHMVALQQGACILRAHDVREAREVITLWQLLQD